MLFEPTWISSEEHLRAFERAYRETSIFAALSVRSSSRKDFPTPGDLLAHPGVCR
jgi:hypothetical protein